MSRQTLCRLTVIVILCVLGAHPVCPVSHAVAGNPADKEGETMGRAGYERLLLKTQNEGTVRVIVRLGVPFSAEAAPSARDATDRRSAITKAQDRVLRELAARGLKPAALHKYRYTPYMAMTVGAEALEALAASPDVAGIEEDVPARPSSYLQFDFTYFLV